MGRLESRVIFLTGGGGVLGRASARLFAREGARVAVVDSSGETAEETAAQVERDGGEALALQADVTREGEVAVAATVGRWGGNYGLFNNAGIMPHEDVSVLDMEDEVWSRVYDTNVRGTALCSKHAIPHILDAGGGAVANMSSFVHVMGSTRPQDAYAASWGAVVSMTRSMAVQFGGRGVRVNALCPGPIDTEHVRRNFPDEAARRRRLDRIPLGRFGEPGNVAGLALFLLSDEAAWITGQAILLDGGISCHYL